ncbi:TonB family protein [Dolichospermum sp. ST_sed1]|nr:TonB family protein [Dolichospermum sp. ST_sed1]MDD1427905.1 TonB family protein [Dolichospermum sp. ST_sed9]MDD1434182.1 TonB family protein [Dolichospermum sp. ST_sed6]MDD1435221.1 TonB family protein [Dolichospermum sp. ST_sed10]MDD1443555.1 TonB family protein [Dolichospermum sp. ST_sed3]MDD1449172.1 TonB family protein [Dolichospermum sp. ST_sed8]MDD1457833.1 TonB family protein [Dolichospermum sp. ST_sed7]MDD1463182.1 TonB family protein [Dolichospermum sp. ST_sed2]MDD1474386.1 Ton
MSLSIFTIGQREKEAEALKTFLFFSLIGSLALHIGLLALAINKFLFKAPEVIEKPIEVTILETIPQEVAQLPLKTKSLAKINSGSSNGDGGISTPTETSMTTSNSAVAPLTKQPQAKTINNLVPQQAQIHTTSKPTKIPTLLETKPIGKTISKPAKISTLLETKPIEKTISEPGKIPTLLENLGENTNTPASTQPQANIKPGDIPVLKSETPTNVSANNTPNNSTTSTQSPQNKISHTESIPGNLGDRLRNSLGKGIGSGTNSGTGIGSGTNSGTGIGNQMGNNPKLENTPIATAAKPPIKTGSKLNRADCIQCQIKYPDRARRRGVEGTAEVAIDTDSQGNVTQVRLVSSSGDSELDEAAQQAAQEWKLTPTETGREGVRASVNFAMKGSQRHRQLQERPKR